jgi:ADP-ribosylglycohydrolase
VQQPELAAALRKALDLAAAGASITEAAGALGTSGYVVHSVPLATFCFVRFGDDALSSLAEAIAAGGDTDTNGAIVGALVGCLHGPEGLPRDLVRRIVGGPFGPEHLRRLALALADPKRATLPGYSVTVALLRNLALFPVVLLHALRRILP